MVAITFPGLSPYNHQYDGHYAGKHFSPSLVIGKNRWKLSVPRLPNTVKFTFNH